MTSDFYSLGTVGKLVNIGFLFDDLAITLTKIYMNLSLSKKDYLILDNSISKIEIILLDKRPDSTSLKSKSFLRIEEIFPAEVDTKNDYIVKLEASYHFLEEILIELKMLKSNKETISKDNLNSLREKVSLLSKSTLKSSIENIEESYKSPIPIRN